MSNEVLQNPAANNAGADSSRSQWYRTEDWWAVVIGLALLAGSLASVAGMGGPVEKGSEHPLGRFVATPAEWTETPAEAFWPAEKPSPVDGIVAVALVSAMLFGAAAAALGVGFAAFLPAFFGLFSLATLAYLLSGQVVIKYYGLEYALWALLVGMAISNTVGVPAWLRPALRTELYIKTGLVLLGGEILLSRLLALGLPGVAVSWVTTPIVLVGTYQFGQRVLRMPSRTLNLVIAADMSVCGVSAAIATGAACRARKEEISLAIGLSLAFTVVMMVAMPALIHALGMPEVLGGAWIGGTIDSTGAVAAAGAMLGKKALEVATTVKMIQNILIGVIAFAVAILWSTEGRESSSDRPSWWDIWRRFPKFVIGFVAASAIDSVIAARGPEGTALTLLATTKFTTVLRGWFFCLGFISIGLESRLADYAEYFRDGKPLVLYIVGQLFNLALTLFMAWLMFIVVFPDAAR